MYVTAFNFTNIKLAINSISLFFNLCSFVSFYILYIINMKVTKCVLSEAYLYFSS